MPSITDWAAPAASTESLSARLVATAPRVAAALSEGGSGIAQLVGRGGVADPDGDEHRTLTTGNHQGLSDGSR